MTGYGEVSHHQKIYILLIIKLNVITFLFYSIHQQNGTGDANDVWKVLILHGREGDVIETVTSKLRFVHYLHHCVLTCSGKTLPKW